MNNYDKIQELQNCINAIVENYLEGDLSEDIDILINPIQQEIDELISQDYAIHNKTRNVSI